MCNRNNYQARTHEKYPMNLLHRMLGSHTEHSRSAQLNETNMNFLNPMHHHTNHIQDYLFPADEVEEPLIAILEAGQKTIVNYRSPVRSPLDPSYRSTILLHCI